MRPLWDDADGAAEDAGMSDCDPVAKRRIRQFDRDKIAKLCGCWCRNGWCYPCAWVNPNRPPVSQGLTAIAYGGNTPEGE